MMIIMKYRWLTKAEVFTDGCDVEVRATLFDRNSEPVTVMAGQDSVKVRLEIKTEVEAKGAKGEAESVKDEVVMSVLASRRCSVGTTGSGRVKLVCRGGWRGQGPTS